MATVQTDDIPTQKLLKEYTKLAPAYDQLWSAYLNASLRLTLDKIAALAPERVLDIACGTGQLLGLLAERSDLVELVGIDIQRSADEDTRWGTVPRGPSGSGENARSAMMKRLRSNGKHMAEVRC